MPRVYCGSTIIYLVIFKERILKFINNRAQTDTVLTDFKKAYRIINSSKSPYSQILIVRYFRRVVILISLFSNTFQIIKYSNYRRLPHTSHHR